MTINLTLPRPAAAGSALQPQAYAEAFAAGVATERAKWVTAAGAVSALGMHPSTDAVAWDDIATELNASAGFTPGDTRSEASATALAAEMNAEFGVSRPTTGA